MGAGVGREDGQWLGPEKPQQAKGKMGAEADWESSSWLVMGYDFGQDGYYESNHRVNTLYYYRVSQTLILKSDKPGGFGFAIN